MLFLGVIDESGAGTRSYGIQREADYILSGAESMSQVGDINGDGVLDLALKRCVTENREGIVWVLFGPFQEGAASVTERVSNGFVIRGSQEWTHACHTEPAGDINGDGLDDLLVGSPDANHNERHWSGSIYVVFGKTTTDEVALSEFDSNTQGDAGFRIDGATGRSHVGARGDHFGVGDINRDGLDDIAAGAPFAGASYVIFGKTDPLPIDLLSFHRGTHGGSGYLIRTKSPNRDSGYGVAAAGDVNADGIPDVLVGVQPKLSSRGFVYVVFGKADADPVDTSDLGRKGFEIVGPYSGSDLGRRMGAAGDVNQDGKDDLLLAASGNLVSAPGAVYVVFGKTRVKPIDLTEMGKTGYVIVGREGHDESVGGDVTSIGDLNADGRPDALIGASGADYSAKQAGAAFVVYGKDGYRKVRTGNLRRHGYRIDGSSAGHLLGATVVGPGDLNGDGIPDLVTSAASDGTVYLVWGRR